MEGMIGLFFGFVGGVVFAAYRLGGEDSLKETLLRIFGKE